VKKLPASSVEKEQKRISGNGRVFIVTETTIEGTVSEREREREREREKGRARDKGLICNSLSELDERKAFGPIACCASEGCCSSSSCTSSSSPLPGDEGALGVSAGQRPLSLSPSLW
jgi:hypothetical protein